MNKFVYKCVFRLFLLIFLISSNEAIATPDNNNTCSSTTLIELNNEPIIPTLNPVDDPEDYFNITVPSDYTVNLTLGTAVPNPCLVTWILYEEGGDCSTIKSSGQIDKNIVYTWEKLIEEPGNYKLLLRHGGDATGDSPIYMIVAETFTPTHQSACPAASCAHRLPGFSDFFC